MAELEKLGQKYRVALRYLPLKISKGLSAFASFYLWILNWVSFVGLRKILASRDYLVYTKAHMLMTASLTELLR